MPASGKFIKRGESMKRDDTDKQDGLAAETVEEAKKLADLYTARAHKAKLRLKQTRKTYKEQEGGEKARKRVKTLKERARKAKPKTVRKTARRRVKRHTKIAEGLRSKSEAGPLPVKPAEPARPLCLRPLHRWRLIGSPSRFTSSG